MAVYKGRNGKLRIGKVDTSEQTATEDTTQQAAIGQIASWRISGGPDIEDITEFGDSWGNHVTTLKRWSGSAEGYLDVAAASSEQDNILGLVVDGFTVDQTNTGDTLGHVQGQFNIDTTGGTGAILGLIGNIIPSFEITGTVGGIFLVSFTFQGSGALAYITNGTT
jgi:hypothetical protein